MGRDDDTRAAWQAMVGVFMSDEVHDRFHDACEAAGLPHPGALKLLMHLDADDPPPMRAIANLLRCDASYVTVLVDALEQPGLVERRPAPGDRRVKLVAVTAAGIAARELANEVMSQPPKSFGRLSAAEAKQLARLLAKATDVDPLPGR